MKKLQKLLLLAIFSIGIFGTVKAAVPEVDANQLGVVAGGTYTYTVPNTAGQSLTWTIINSEGNTIDGNGGEFAMTDVEAYKKTITWNTNGTFYVLVETTIDATRCTNQYAIKVDVATNDYVVAFNPATENEYCADDANIASGLEILLDVKLGDETPAASYYDMEVQYKVDNGAIQTATITSENKFNITGITIADPVSPAMTDITVTIVKVTDKNGVIVTPTDANKDYVITINPIPAKPTITFE